jgi:hypothetical protein
MLTASLTFFLSYVAASYTKRISCMFSTGGTSASSMRRIPSRFAPHDAQW